MNALPRLRTWLDRIVDRILAVAGALVFSQAPEFFQQYLQRLGGHLDEARRTLAQFERTAAEAGLTLDRFITQTSTNYDQAVAKLAQVMTAAVERVQHLDAAFTALRDASVWTRPFAFLRHLDGAIAHATWTDYKPAVPTTAEGFIYAAAGMLVFLGIYHLVFRRLIRPREPKPVIEAGR
jgi:hypothetical protein